MAEDYVSKLNYAFSKRRGKLLKYRRQMNLCSAVGAVGLAVLALALLRFPGADSPFAAWAAPLILLLVGGVIATAGFTQRSYYKRKYDRLRETTISVMQAYPICNCFWQPCSCKDDFIADMDERHNINLSY
jgi:hypothetical protein